jgi:hypothetical protein
MAKKSTKKPTHKLDAAEIIKRGYCTVGEYKAMVKSGLNKLNFMVSSGSEGIWVYPLEPDNEPGRRFHFVFHNDPISLMGAPRPIAGLVGIATSNGPSQRAVAEIDECIALFKAAGKPAIDYTNSRRK